MKNDMAASKAAAQIAGCPNGLKRQDRCLTQIGAGFIRGGDGDECVSRGGGDEIGQGGGCSGVEMGVKISRRDTLPSGSIKAAL